ncbi:MAG: hypothetical protein WC011_03175 [Candidatus Paceibacterota bacterium]
MVNHAKNKVISSEILEYLKLRELEKSQHQKDFEDFNSKMKKHVSENSQKILLSIPLKECFVFIKASIAETFFKLLGKDPDFGAPDEKLKLSEVQILYSEYFALDEGYFSAFDLNFVFENKACDNYWSAFSLEKLFFDDEEFKMVNNSMGLCLDPKFENQKDYISIKDKILQSKAELGV